MEKLTDKEYFALPRFSHSAMKNFEQSPLHYLHDKRTPTEPTEAMVLGSAFHCRILEPDEFWKRYAVAPIVDRRTTIGKETWRMFCDANQGKNIITTEMLELIKRMEEAINKNPASREILDVITETEKPLLWKQTETGVECKGKIDGIGEIILDLKTCMDARPEFFHKTVLNDYKRQPAMYVEGAKANKLGSKDFYFIAIEKKPPFGISVHKVGRDFLDFGSQSVYKICQDFAYWQEMGSPEVGYEWRAPLGYFTINVPYWLK
jgi:hypothetical protein